jgi:hypothetical protein
MIEWVPVLGEYYVLKFFSDMIYDRNHLVTVWYCKVAAWAEIVLYINDNQDIVVAHFYSLAHS